MNWRVVVGVDFNGMDATSRLVCAVVSPTQANLIEKGTQVVLRDHDGVQMLADVVDVRQGHGGRMMVEAATR